MFASRTSRPLPYCSCPQHVASIDHGCIRFRTCSCALAGESQTSRASCLCACGIGGKIGFQGRENHAGFANVIYQHRARNIHFRLYMSSGLKTSGRARFPCAALMLNLLRFLSSCSNRSASSSSAFLLSASACSSGLSIVVGSRPSSIMRCISASAPCCMIPWLGHGSNGRLLNDSSQSCDCWGIACRPTISDRTYGVFSLSCAPGGGVAMPFVI